MANSSLFSRSFLNRRKYRNIIATNVPPTPDKKLCDGAAPECDGSQAVIIHRTVITSGESRCFTNKFKMRKACPGDGEQMRSASGVSPEILESVCGVTKPPVERLIDPQKAKIAKTAKLSFNDMDWAEIDVARHDFTSMCRTKPRSLEDRRVAMRLGAIANSFHYAVDALRAPQRNNDEDQISTYRKTIVLLALELSSDRSAPKLVQIIFLTNALQSAARRAQLKAIEDADKNYSRFRWTPLIHTLASIFEAHGCKPTAAKWARASEPHASVFVEFVRAVLETLPSEVNECRKSIGAISKIVSDGLKSHRIVRRVLKTGRNDSIC